MKHGLMIVCAAAAGMLGGCANPQADFLREYDATPAAHAVEVRQAPYDEVARARAEDAAQLVDEVYFTAQDAGLNTPEGTKVVRLVAAEKGATRVRWGRRLLYEGQPMPPEVNVNVGDPYYPAYRPVGRGFDPNANANAMMAGAEAGSRAAARNAAAVAASMPTYEYLILYYR